MVRQEGDIERLQGRMQDLLLESEGEVKRKPVQQTLALPPRKSRGDDGENVSLSPAVLACN